MRHIIGLALLGLTAGFPEGCASPQSKTLELRPVNYDGLKQLVRQSRGKVLVVDFWGEF